LLLLNRQHCGACALEAGWIFDREVGKSGRFQQPQGWPFLDIEKGLDV
jgi:hypothetical protein